MKKLFRRILAYCIETIAPKDPLVATIERGGLASFYTQVPRAEMQGYISDPEVTFYSLMAYKHKTVQTTLLEVKSYGYRPLARILAWGVREHLLSYRTQYPEDIFYIIPIPITRTSLSLRGFNQCELIIRECFHITDSSTHLFTTHFKIRTDLLFKVRNTRDQVGRNRVERQENLRNCFKTRKETDITGASIIIFDDILTTGATIHEAVQTLKPHKPKRIYALTIAH